jgi:hypothetical protein
VRVGVGGRVCVRVCGCVGVDVGVGESKSTQSPSPTHTLKVVKESTIQVSSLKIESSPKFDWSFDIVVIC